VEEARMEKGPKGLILAYWPGEDIPVMTEVANLVLDVKKQNGEFEYPEDPVSAKSKAKTQAKTSAKAKVAAKSVGKASGKAKAKASAKASGTQEAKAKAKTKEAKGKK
jgi:hypothetical protein